ncbi:MAG: CHASE2 domain-containing protein, partial [Gammaproteobacteria bacterium]|nr:CHASE2 domain-containing protein [Gammaproteobacteria bacterium]
MKRDWRSFRFWTGHITFIGVLFVIALILSHSQTMQELERSGLSFAMQWMPETALRADVAVVAIDEPSLNAYGPWPWPRDRLGRAIRKLEDHGVNAVGLALPLDQSQTPPGLADLKLEIQDGEDKLKSKIAEIDSRPRTKNKSTLAARKKQRDKMKIGLEQLETTIYWLNRLDSDKKLANQLSGSKNTILPAYYLRSLSYQPLPQSLQKFTVTEIEEVRPWYMSSWLA